MEARQAFIASFSYVSKGKNDTPIFPYSKEYPSRPELIFFLNLIS
jgi:hypothetical protein